jgi:aldehyde:ferredoxin oxidoreductase
MFYKESMLFCDWLFATVDSPGSKTGRGAIPEAEPILINEVTGRGMNFIDGIEIRGKTWNVIRAIFSMQRKNRDAEKVSNYRYRPGAAKAHCRSCSGRL